VLVLQHGFLCGPEYWHNQVDFLSHKFDVITPTLPGFADFNAATAISSISGFSDYLLNLLDDLDIEHFHLLGHSMGGMIAQQMALQAGDRIDRLVLFGTGPIGEMPGRFETVQQSADRVRQNGLGDLVENTVATWFVKGAEDPHFAETVAIGSQVSTEAVLGGYEAFKSWRSLERLEEVSNKTRVIWGDCDRSYRRDQVELLGSHIPDCELVVMPGCSHNAHLENPQVFNIHVQEFLEYSAD
jgi:2-hydroxy-6-oxonona-2,4-dienedioate hydrolase